MLDSISFHAHKTLQGELKISVKIGFRGTKWLKVSGSFWSPSLWFKWGFPGGSMQDTQVQSLGWEDPPEKGIATHSSILVWRTPWTEEPGGLPSRGSQRVRHDQVTDTCTFADTVSIYLKLVLVGLFPQDSKHVALLSCEYRHVHEKGPSLPVTG